LVLGVSDDDVSLVYMPDSERRDVNPARARPGDIVSFADGYPMLLISEASLSDLNARLEQPIEMRRFRPNLVISECEPYAEDAFTAVQIGGLGFRGVKRCDRCVVTTIDPDTAERGKEPLRTLSTTPERQQGLVRYEPDSRRLGHAARRRRRQRVVESTPR